MRLARLSFNINGVNRFITCDPENDTLAEVLRRMGLTGVKVGCGTGVCGACSVLLNGEVVRACTKKMKRVAEFSTITTIEGIGTPQHLHPLQQAWITYSAAPSAASARPDHRLRLRTPGREPRAQSRRRTYLVQGPPQHLPLHRI